MQRARVLIVDSDVKLAESIKTRLEKTEFLADCARQGKEALDILRTKWIDLIVMDLSLKGNIKGINLYNQIKKNKELSKIPVFVHTASNSMRKAMKYLGAEAVFIKPYPFELLLNEIKDILLKKVLVLGEDNNTRAQIMKKLAGYDHGIDIVSKINSLYQKILTRRYGLIVMQHKLGNNYADMLSYLIRCSRKNEETPMLIYTSNKHFEIDSEGEKIIEKMKNNFSSLNNCVFIEKEQLNKKFKPVVEKFFFN
jgi:DNA-binding response OmpR family regulator